MSPELARLSGILDRIQLQGVFRFLRCHLDFKPFGHETVRLTGQMETIDVKSQTRAHPSLPTVGLHVQGTARARTKDRSKNPRASVGNVETRTE